MDDRKLYTTQEAAQQLGLTSGYMRTLIITGKAHPVKQIGGTWMFTIDEIKRLRTRKRTRGPAKKQ